jgi:stage II sporulation protein D
MHRNLCIIGVAGAVLACGPATADAAKRFTIRGAGFGHGVGMSQYGAMGYASHGWGYKAILAHYYTDTELGVLSEPLVDCSSTCTTRGSDNTPSSVSV